MDTTFIRDRITELRLQKGVSEYKMSMDLGHSKSYIQSISSGKSLPSLSEFLYICEYFDISPNAFFDTETCDLQLIEQPKNELKQFKINLRINQTIKSEITKDCKADIRNPLSLLAHERSCFATCQWELLTPTDISIPLTHRLVLYALESGECLFCVQFV